MGKANLSSTLQTYIYQIFRIQIFTILICLSRHGGDECSDFCAKNMHQFFQQSFNARVDAQGGTIEHENIRSVEKLLHESMLETFQRTDREFLAEFGESKPVAGSTASVAILSPIYHTGDHVNTILTVGHVGDTRIILCDVGTGKAQTLTVDHKPWEKRERKRIEKSGGFVIADSFGQQAMMGIIAVSRAVGVAKLKQKANTILISEPDVASKVIDPSHMFIVGVSDGNLPLYNPCCTCMSTHEYNMYVCRYNGGNE
jgi:serine/threonine protein phosphatase PrpC